MPATATLIGTAAVSITGASGSFTITTTADVQAGDKIVLFDSSNVGGTYGPISDDAGNTYAVGGFPKIVESAVFTPAGTIITIPYSGGGDGFSAEIFAYGISGLTGTVTSFAGSAYPIGAFTHNVGDSPASGDYFYLAVAGDSLTQGTSGATIETAYVSGGWTDGDTAQHEAPVTNSTTHITDYHVARLHTFFKSWTGNGTAVSLSGNNTHSGTSGLVFEAWGIAYVLRWGVARTGDLDAVMDATRTGKWILRDDGTNLTLARWVLGSNGRFSSVSPTTVVAGGSSPSLVRLRDGRLSLAYVLSGAVKQRIWTVGAGAGTVVSVGTGTLCTHTQDKYGRLIVAVYDSGWKVSVGTLGSGGTYSFSSPASMGLTADAVRGSLEAMPDGSLQFTYVNGGAVSLVVCRTLSSTGSGTWS